MVKYHMPLRACDIYVIRKFFDFRFRPYTSPRIQNVSAGLKDRKKVSHAFKGILMKLENFSTLSFALYTSPRIQNVCTDLKDRKKYHMPLRSYL